MSNAELKEEVLETKVKLATIVFKFFYLSKKSDSSFIFLSLYF